MKVKVYPGDGGLCYAAPVERFWSKVRVAGPDECWLWQGTRNKSGPYAYGRFQLEGRWTTAHRVAYVLMVGPIDDGHVVDHLCRVRLCCNPAHLEAVTNRENVLRGEGPTAANARKSRCDRGHEFVVLADGSRECPTCARAAKKRWKDRRRHDPEYVAHRRRLERERYRWRMDNEPGFREAQAEKQRRLNARKRDGSGR